MIHGLETRPTFLWYGCIEPSWKEIKEIAFADWEVALQSQDVESVRADSGGFCLAKATMVCSPVVDAIPKSNHSSKVPIPVEKSLNELYTS